MRFDSRRVCTVFVLGLSLLWASCSRQKVARGPVPAVPPLIDTQDTSEQGPSPQPRKNSGNEANVRKVPVDRKPIFVETGIASWYGPPYHNRRGSDGTIYNMKAMTAAHRTLPLGSTVRVTNLETGHSAIVRITDRGPFIKGRIVDLSLAAAKQTDVQRAGLAEVRIEVLDSPAALDSGGRWAVQIGSFQQQQSAAKLAEQLSRRYHSAKVLSFSSPVGDWWVRVRVLHDDRERAQEVVRNTLTDREKVFLVRLD